MFFVYIIETVDGTYYTGITNDVARRMKEHLNGGSKSARYLRAHKPAYLVYLRECKTRSDALRLERRLKKDRRYKMHCIGPRRDLHELVEAEEDMA